jgi:hypothetical protein
MLDNHLLGYELIRAGLDIALVLVGAWVTRRAR